jgi:hypothetical protein
MVLIVAVAVCPLLDRTHARAASSQVQPIAATTTLSAAAATSIGLAAAANYALGQNSRWRDYETVVVLSVLTEVAKGVRPGTTMTAAQYTTIAAQVRAYLDTQLPAVRVFPDEAAVFRYAINALVGLVASPSVDPRLGVAISRVEHLKATALQVRVDPSRDTPADLAMYEPNAFAFVSDRVQEASDLAHEHAAFALAINPLLSALVGFDTTASYALLAAAYPQALPALPPTNADGSVTLDLQALLAQFHSVVNDIGVVTDEHLASIQSQPNVIGVSSSGVPGRSRARVVASAPTPSCTAGLPGSGDAIVLQANDCTANAGKPPDYWSKAQAGLDALARFVGHLDPTAGRLISTVGGALIEAGKAIATIDGIVQKGSIFSSFASLLAFSKPVIALVQAGIAIFSAFSEGSSGNPNGEVLAAIQQLSQQITRLEENMTNRFDQVDAKLNAILETLNSNFALINYELGVLEGDVHTVQAALLDVRAQLNRIEQYTLAYHQAQSRANLILQLNGCLNYAAIHNGANIGRSKYNECENAFYTWAHDNALDELWAGVRQPSYADHNIYGTLLNFPESVNVNYLAQFPAQNLGLPALAQGTRIANPNEWVLGAASYLQLAHEWPQHAADISSSRLDDLIQTGMGLQRAAQKASGTRSGSIFTPNRSLFTATINKYQTGTERLQTAVQSVIDAYTSNPANRLQNVNLWGGQSSFNWIPPITTINGCGAPISLPLPGAVTGQSIGTPTVPHVPVNILYSVPVPALIATYMDLGTIDVCLFPGWDSSLRNLQVTLAARYQGRVITSQFVSNRLIVSNPSGTNIWSLVQENWQQGLNLSSQFATFGQSTFIVPPDEQEIVQGATAAVDDRLRTHQRAVYGAIASGLGAVGELQDAAQLLTGAKLLLQAYVDFGLPNSVQVSNPLRAMLYGNESIFDAVAFQADLLEFASAPIPDVTDNKIADEFAAADVRLATVSAAITAALDQLESNQWPDSLATVDLVLADLRAFGILKDSDLIVVPPACAVNTLVALQSSRLIGSSRRGSRGKLQSQSSVTTSDSGLVATIDAAAFRRFRDHALRRSAAGRRLSALYEAHSPEVVGLLLKDAPLRASLMRGLVLWQSDVPALTDGRGMARITVAQVDVVDEVANRLAALGSLALRQAIERERRACQPGFRLAECLVGEVTR